MSWFTDTEYLLSDQYRTASNLNARIQLHRRFSTNKYGWTLWIFDHLQLLADSRILDVGCGPGNLWRENIARIPDGWEITLSDFSPGMLGRAHDNLRDCRSRFEFQVVDAQAIPFKDGTFDAVTANFMLYHVPDRPRALSEMHRVLKNGGRLYAATHGCDHMREIRELISTIDPHANQTSAASGFGLENGFDQLSQFFSRVTLDRYEDALVVTEVEPLVAYILSTKRSALVNKKPETLVRLIERQMKLKGNIFITKDGGMFEAVKESRDQEPGQAGSDAPAPPH